MSGKLAGPGVVGEEGLSQQSEWDGVTGSIAGTYGKTGGFHALSHAAFDEIDCCSENALCCTSNNGAVYVFSLKATTVPGEPKYRTDSAVEVSQSTPWQLDLRPLGAA